MLDGLIFCCCWYVLKETSLSVCQVMKTPWELMDTNCREALELWTALVYYWQLNAHTHIQPVGPPVSRGVTFLFGCAAMRVQRLSWSSLHTAEDAHMMKDPKVPLVFVTTLLPLFPLCSGGLTSPVCHMQSGQFCSVRSRQRAKSRIVPLFGSLNVWFSCIVITESLHKP